MSKSKNGFAVVLKSDNMYEEKFQQLGDHLNKAMEPLNLAGKVPVFSISSTDTVLVHQLNSNGKTLNMIVLNSDDLTADDAQELEDSIRKELPTFPVGVIVIGQDDSLEFFQLNQGE